jgi:hypothetical protein
MELLIKSLLIASLCLVVESRAGANFDHAEEDLGRPIDTEHRSRSTYEVTSPYRRFPSGMYRRGTVFLYFDGNDGIKIYDTRISSMYPLETGTFDCGYSVCDVSLKLTGVKWRFSLNQQGTVMVDKYGQSYYRDTAPIAVDPIAIDPLYPPPVIATDPIYPPPQQKPVDMKKVKKTLEEILREIEMQKIKNDLQKIIRDNNLR